MPELVEVEIVKNELSRRLVGSRFEAPSSALYSDILETIIKYPNISNIRRRGKFLIFTLINEIDQRELIVHLGMTGKLLISAIPLEGKHLHFQAKIVGNGPDAYLGFVDPRKFGKLTVVRPNNYTGLLKLLGPELTDSGHPFGLVTKTKKPIKAILLEQRFIAGVGNYLADESLFRARLSPLRPGSSLKDADLSRLVDALKAVVRESMAAGGLSFSDYQHTDGSVGGFLGQLQVYGRSGEICKSCGELLTTIKLAGRTTVFCEGCQK